MSVEALVPRVRRALGVSSSYDNEIVPDLIRQAVGRLLRDYNLPKSVGRWYFGSAGGGAEGSSTRTLALGQQSFSLPPGFKRDFQLRFYDPAEETWSEPLEKREAFVMPSASGATSNYWLEGTTLWIDTAIEADGVGKQLIFFYQGMDIATNESWVTDDWPDAVAYQATMRGAVDVRKPEVAAAYVQLWADERESLAIYLNELEWGNVVMMQRERKIPALDRYPIA